MAASRSIPCDPPEWPACPSRWNKHAPTASTDTGRAERGSSARVLQTSSFSALSVVSSIPRPKQPLHGSRVSRASADQRCSIRRNKGGANLSGLSPMPATHSPTSRAFYRVSRPVMGSPRPADKNRSVRRPVSRRQGCRAGERAPRTTSPLRSGRSQIAG